MINITHTIIPVDIYRHLRVASCLSAKLHEAAELGLKNSLHSVLLRDDAGNALGMGRVIGDGGCFCQVVDICVLPEWQGRGLGKIIMEDIIAYIATLPESCYISLLADGEAYRLYEKYGFKDTLPLSRGMFVKR